MSGSSSRPTSVRGLYSKNIRLVKKAFLTSQHRRRKNGCSCLLPYPPPPPSYHRRHHTFLRQHPCFLRRMNRQERTAQSSSSRPSTFQQRWACLLKWERHCCRSNIGQESASTRHQRRQRSCSRPRKRRLVGCNLLAQGIPRLTPLKLDNPEDADMYFTDRLAAPSSTFVPAPAPEADGSGYLPDREIYRLIFPNFTDC